MCRWRNALGPTYVTAVVDEARYIALPRRIDHKVAVDPEQIAAADTCAPNNEFVLQRRKI